MAEAKKTTQCLKHLHFWLLEAVEVIMADGANEATPSEVARFT